MTDNADLDGSVTPDPIYTNIAAGFVRGGLQIASGAGFAWAASVPDQQVMLIASGLAMVGTMAWSAYSKIKARRIRHDAAMQSANRSAQATDRAGTPVAVAVLNPRAG